MITITIIFLVLSITVCSIFSMYLVNIEHILQIFMFPQNCLNI